MRFRWTGAWLNCLGIAIAASAAIAAEAEDRYAPNATALKAFFADLEQQVAQPFRLVELKLALGDIDAVVQLVSDAEVYDRYSFDSNDGFEEPEPVKVGHVECRKGFSFGAKELAGATQAFRDAAKRVDGSLFTAEIVRGMFCGKPHWQIAVSVTEPERMSRYLNYKLDGKFVNEGM